MSLGGAPAAVLGLGLLLGACGPPPRALPAPPKHLLLISIDTLRADHLGCYGYARPTSPNLDALAAASVLFENASSAAPWTLPAHASLLTGLYPAHHGVRDDRQSLRGAETLAEHLERAGFSTGAVVNATFLGKRYGLARGFDVYKRLPESQKPAGAASGVSSRGLAWLRRHGERSFLFLHYFDVHSDYSSLPRFERMFTSGGRLTGRTSEVMALARGREQPRSEEIAHLVDLYDASIRQIDAQLGRLFAKLRALGRWDDTLLVVTSDHGEEFADHGLFFHGLTHYEETLRVPLLVRWPGGPEGLRIAEPVSLVDVLPTLLAALALEIPAGLDGVDLTPLFQGGRVPRRTILAETGPQMRDELRSAREGNFKLILHPQRNSLQLFDLEADPQERREVSSEHPAIVQRLSRAIQALDGGAVTAGDGLDLPAEVVDQLRALGYGHGHAPPPQGAPTTDPEAVEDPGRSQPGAGERPTSAAAPPAGRASASSSRPGTSASPARPRATAR